MAMGVGRADPAEEYKQLVLVEEIESFGQLWAIPSSSHRDRILADKGSFTWVCHDLVRDDSSR
jgi:hypothetical protein